METPLIEIRNVSKSFGNRAALANISVDFCQGEVHAILGENGAGKSTLMNVLYGLYQQDDGEIFLDGAKLELNVPQDAINAGIGMIHQHFMLVPSFTVAENVVLGDSRYRRMAFDRKRAEREVALLSRKLGLTIDPRARVEDLAIGQQQRVEIIKALFRGAKLLILDEPTAVLTPQETEELFTTLRRLRNEERAIIFISHKLAEVRAISDRVTVLRRGQTVGTFPTEEVSETELARHMVGEDLGALGRADFAEPPPREIVSVGKPILHVENLWLRRPDGGEALRGLSFDLSPGEILGIAGVDGNGQRELAEELIGVRPPRYKGFLERGRIWLGNQEITVLETRFRFELGMAEIPSDRRAMGIFPGFSIVENLMAFFHREKPFRWRQFLKLGAIRKWCVELIKLYDIRTETLEQPAEILSGGNQQKLVVAREMSRQPRVLIAVNPTRGVDILSAARIRAELLELKTRGAAILLITTDLDEVIELSDRVAVMVAGQFSGMLMAGAGREHYGRLMLGVAATHGTTTTYEKQTT